jgi:homospermidine synthase
MNTTIKTWCPTPGPQVGFMVTHDEAISISDYYTVKEGDNVVYRPTCHYAYHPCEDAISSCFGILGKA